MKKLLFLTLLTAIAFIPGRSSAQVSINVSIGSRPVWHPAVYSQPGYYRTDYYTPVIVNAPRHYPYHVKYKKHRSYRPAPVVYYRNDSRHYVREYNRHNGRGKGNYYGRGNHDKGNGRGHDRGRR